MRLGRWDRDAGRDKLACNINTPCGEMWQRALQKASAILSYLKPGAWERQKVPGSGAVDGDGDGGDVLFAASKSKKRSLLGIKRRATSTRRWPPLFWCKHCPPKGQRLLSQHADDLNDDDRETNTSLHLCMNKVLVRGLNAV
ncbi:hypothetical protein ABW21_db0209508 [Orbilia brochopaga]|nr:hypothetical protein ABW21_db0209508 [Drechslerella brochopaga]